MSGFPELDERVRGWLRFVWDKATTPDDWSSAGEPLPWWDRDSSAPMCAFPRFDLSETAYILPLLADLTPAWREVYTRIADELVGRHTTFWAAVDWLTLIGHDPHQDRVPPEWLGFLPERLRGGYDPPGWTANGVEPWGLQPDPIGADGNLFFRGFMNLVLSIHKSVSGSDAWERPFEVTGYRERRFEWTHGRIAEFLHLQWKDRPQGPHCENTKIWPFCLSGAGLGLQLYDVVSGSRYHGVYDEWLEYAKKHYLALDAQGNLAMFPLYYDPLADEVCAFPDPLVAFAILITLPYVLPQAPEFGRWLYDQAMQKLGWNDPRRPIVSIGPDPRLVAAGLLVAQDVDDATTVKRLRAYAEERFDPRWFGAEKDRFGWWFGLNEPYPRGQLSALVMASEVAGTGAWSRAFRAPNRAKFSEPTVEGIDYPALGVSRAWNDAGEGMLHLTTYAATPSRGGSATTFRVTQLPDPAGVTVWRDGEPYPRWRVAGDGAIAIDTEVGGHAYRVATRPRDAQGAKGASDSRSAASGASGGGAIASPSTNAAEPRRYRPEATASCACCAASPNAGSTE